MQIEYLKVSSIKPYEKNTRKHTDNDVGELIKSIERFGFNDKQKSAKYYIQKHKQQKVSW